jgi:hypothetical protein
VKTSSDGELIEHMAAITKILPKSSTLTHLCPIYIFCPNGLMGLGLVRSLILVRRMDATGNGRWMTYPTLWYIALPFTALHC